MFPFLGSFSRRMPLAACAMMLVLISPPHEGFSRPGKDPNEATDELEKQRREDAAKEFEKAKKKLDQLESRAQTLRLWTQVRFHFDVVAPSVKANSAYRERLLRHRDQTRNTLLQLPERAGGAIKTGRALNFFLDECGPAAFELVHYRSLDTSEERKMAADEIKRELLSGLTENYKIDQPLVRHVAVMRGETGLKLTGRLNAVPLDLDHLPSKLREREFEDAVERIRTFRDAALAELKAGRPVSAETANGLMDGVDSLLADIHAAKKKHAKRSFTKYRPYLQAERHMLALFAGASRLIEANEERDVLTDEFQGGNIEELLAYMHRNHLHFGPADDNAEGAYRTLFELMAKYYCDLRTLQQAAKDTEDQKAAEEGHARKLEDIMLGVSLNNQQKTDLWLKGMEIVQAIIEK